MSDLGANDMRALINLEIQRIYAGWFDVLFKTNKEKVVVAASDAWGNDSPKLFLQILSELVDKPQYSIYVIWDEEPGVYIIFIDKIDDLYNIKIAFSEFCHDELFADIINVIGDVSYDEMKSKLIDLEFCCSLLDTSVSGSLVIQNGRIVGVVTHVLVNDSTKGYAIFLESMLNHGN